MSTACESWKAQKYKDVHVHVLNVVSVYRVYLEVYHFVISGSSQFVAQKILHPFG